MTGAPIETFPQPTRFARNCGTQSMPSPTVRSCGRVMDGTLGATFSRSIPSAWCTGYAVLKSKSSLSLMVDDGRGTGVLASEQAVELPIATDRGSLRSLRRLNRTFGGQRQP